MIAADSAGPPGRRLVTLEPDDVHVAYLRVDEDRGARHEASPLSADELEREARFVFDKDRRLYRSAHALIRSFLSRYAPVAPEAWTFTVGPGGKPRVHGPVPAPPLKFNLSHTRGLAAVAVTLADEIGVDVERIVPPADPDLASVCFTDLERSWLADASGHDRFFELWTLKEAYLKACGQGLALPLKSFSMSIDGPHGAAISFAHQPPAPPIADDPQSWQFYRCRVTPQHALAVAVRRPRSRPLRVFLREWQA